LRAQFRTLAKWAALASPGNWPDADMLPLGHLGPTPGDGEPRETKLTRDEQRTLITLWSIFRSPLIMGGDLPSSDVWTTSLLTNPEVIAVDQHSRENRAAITTDTAAVWVAWPEQEQGYYLAVFNIGDNEQTIHYEWKDLGLDGRGYKLRDLWEHRDLPPATSLNVKLPPHASALYHARVQR